MSRSSPARRRLAEMERLSRWGCARTRAWAPGYVAEVTALVVELERVSARVASAAPRRARLARRLAA